MKQIILINIIFALLTATAQAATISVGNINNIYVANTLVGSSSSSACETAPNQDNCDFLKTGPIEYLTNDALEQIVTSTAETFTLNDAASYALSPYRDSAYIDLGFGDVDIYNGEGNDLVVFIVGNATSFGLDVFDKNGAIINSSIYDVPADGSSTVRDNDDNWLCVNGSVETCAGGAALSAIFIDLGDSIAGDAALGNIRVLLGNDYNGPNDTRPRLSLAGGFHNEAMVVPLPLSSVLFTSGLALLGWIGRKKTV